MAQQFPIGGSKPVLSVIGLGKLGAPMAAVFAAKGYKTIGLDLQTDSVAAINAGKAPVEEPGLQDTVTRGRERLSATTKYREATLGSDISFIIVPTPSRSNGLFTNKYVLQSVKSIGEVLRESENWHNVVVCSTVVPGSMGGQIKATLEEASGKVVGQNVGLCYNPEFIALGSVVKDLLNPDMILIGESDERAGAALEELYKASVDSNPEFHRMNWVNAELTKISVNTFVTTKISYANMIGDMCDHLESADADVVAEAVGADGRIGRKYLKPAIGYGGPCFPRDNKAFSAIGRRLGVNCSLAQATDQINDHQVERLRGTIEAVAPEGCTVAVLGMSYKPDTHVIEESQGVELARVLAHDGYDVIIADPMAAQQAYVALNSKVGVANSATAAVTGAEVVVLTTPWQEYHNIGHIPLTDGARRLIIDPWGIISANSLADGVKLLKLGRARAR